MSGELPLSELQAWMVRLLIEPRSLLRSPQFETETERHVSGNARLRAIEQLEIYREQFWLRHTGSLLEDFPGLSRLLGQESWERLVEGYLQAHPPSSPTLRDLGRALPAYLASESHVSDHGLCVDMARLEWAYVDCFDAADGPSLDVTRLATLSDADWEKGRVVLAPSLRVLALHYSVADLRRQLLDGSEQSPASRQPRETHLVVYRAPDGSLWDTRVTASAAWLLDAFGRGQALVPACEALVTERAEAETELEAELTGWFSSWGKRGWISDFVIDSAPALTSE